MGGILGCVLLGWRSVPTDADKADIGNSARATEPVMEQVFIGAATNDRTSFCRQLYLIRKQAYHAIHELNKPSLNAYYVASMSSRVIVYKGQLTSEQLRLYYPDLSQPDFACHLAMVHSRFSTNTFPSWPLAHPFRFIAHNGEINTVRGNRNWLASRTSDFEHEFWANEEHLLKRLLDDGFGIRATWTLTCRPPGGSHPDPAAADHHPRQSRRPLGAAAALRLASPRPRARPGPGRHAGDLGLDGCHGAAAMPLPVPVLRRGREAVLPIVSALGRRFPRRAL